MDWFRNRGVVLLKAWRLFFNWAAPIIGAMLFYLVYQHAGWRPLYVVAGILAALAAAAIVIAARESS